jgi:hypothetical protein
MAEEKMKNEGEGSRTAAATYNEKTRRFVENEDVEAKAEEAADALDSHEGGELRKAEHELMARVESGAKLIDTRGSTRWYSRRPTRSSLVAKAP